MRASLSVDGRMGVMIILNHPVKVSPKIVCCGNNQARVYDRESAQKLKTTVRGDMYIYDMAKTKGHVAAITSGQFHPK